MSHVSSFRSLVCTGVVLGSLAAMAVPASAVVIMDPTTNNGSFETPDLADYGSASIPGWNHPGGNANFQIRQPGYMAGASNGSQSMHIVNLAGWYSDVLTNSPLIAGETVSMSVDTGWDSWVNGATPQGSVYYLYAVDPGNFANLALILQFNGIANYNGFGTDAGWATASNSALIQGGWNGWYTQIVVASGGTANNMVDNFVVTQTPEPAAMGLLATAGLALLSRNRRRFSATK